MRIVGGVPLLEPEALQVMNVEFQPGDTRPAAHQLADGSGVKVGIVADGLDPTTVATLFLAIPLGIVLLDAAGVEVPGADTWAEVARQTAISLRPQDAKEA